jgi:GDP-4-dehydro-6-deoxy-D-mannose reductase
MRALVTGARGFAGRWLVAHLEQEGHEVVPWGREVDLGQPGAIRAAVAGLGDLDWAFHLGAMADPRAAAEDPVRAHAVNVEGAAVLAGSLSPRCRFVFASSCHVYGHPAQLPIEESHALAPRGTYAQTKADAEAAVVAIRPGAIIARAFHHVGPGQDPRYALAGWVAQLRADAGAPIRVGDLGLRRDISDVRDIVEGYACLAAHAAPGSVVNLCSGVAPPLSHWLEVMAPGATLAPQAELLHGGQVPELRGSPARAHGLGWRPTRQVEDTLREMLSPGECP